MTADEVFFAGWMAGIISTCFVVGIAAGVAKLFKLKGGQNEVQGD